jgi:hypothetical protein
LEFACIFLLTTMPKTGFTFEISILSFNSNIRTIVLFTSMMHQLMELEIM